LKHSLHLRLPSCGLKDGILRANRIHWDEFRCLGPSLTSKPTAEERDRAVRFFEELKLRRGAYYLAGFNLAFELVMHEVEGDPEFVAYMRATWWQDVGQYEAVENSADSGADEAESEIQF
jgi:hypothetical protein